MIYPSTAAQALIAPLLGVHIAVALILSCCWLGEQIAISVWISMQIDLCESVHMSVCVLVSLCVHYEILGIGVCIVGVSMAAAFGGKESMVNTLDSVEELLSPSVEGFPKRVAFLGTITVVIVIMALLGHRSKRLEASSDTRSSVLNTVGVRRLG
eukprot:Gregarina_sp_Poly_1__11361@NODE_959_length_5551_cov_11_991247_g679_i0_p2_GENE_NODE_959_length_5551_cov_11_991247_g679_i0NODE_959_length_5551_cov_11_991247_g679_i0_p2_ORF_typecomplete_len155_score15_98Mg_trans_NIPA/PF05653_14/4_1e06MnhB/PF04039_13/0_18MnhB/PF04039_13/80MnhB/PF04039_13/4_7e02DUF2371/PF10177_9/88DUF2371/PF10177_9/18_NODE_959_length_5551_cov_11_991247_g679_i042044668